jgi:hypothetical protein
MKKKLFVLLMVTGIFNNSFLVSDGTIKDHLEKACEWTCKNKGRASLAGLTAVLSGLAIYKHKLVSKKTASGIAWMKENPTASKRILYALLIGTIIIAPSGICLYKNYDKDKNFTDNIKSSANDAWTKCQNKCTSIKNTITQHPFISTAVGVGVIGAGLAVYDLTKKERSYIKKIASMLYDKIVSSVGTKIVINKR